MVQFTPDVVEQASTGGLDLLQDVVESAATLREPVGIELTGTVRRPVIPAAAQRSQRPPISLLADVPVAGAGRVNFHTVIEPGCLGKATKDELGHRRPADVP